MKNSFMLFLVLLVLGGCIASTPTQSLSPYQQEVNQGRRYFLRECGRCHDPIYPEERSRPEWQGILARKKGKVSLTRPQFARLSKFVLETAGSEK